MNLAEVMPLHQAVERGEAWSGMAGTVGGSAVRAAYFPLPFLPFLPAGNGTGGMVMLELDEPPQQLQADMLRFARGVTHEFNNTLASIQGFAEIAASFATEESPMQVRALQNILRGCEHAEAAIRMGRIMAGRADCKLVPLDLVQTVQDLIDGRRVSLPEGIKTSLFVGDVTEEGCPVAVRHEAISEAYKVQGDSRLLELAFDALWDNALQALGDAGEIVVRLSRRDADAAIALDVHDNGPGMTPEVLAVCAEPYFTTRESAGAKGRGLSLARGVVWLHRGKFFVESTSGKGTTVRLLLPGSTGRP
ncbi:MAG: sensor histidine kinase [Halodesulfovibrio sp.]